MTNRPRPCTPALTAGRLRKAQQFARAFAIIMDVVDQPDEVADACATLAVHAGIAAADVVCCRSLGHHHHGGAHVGAVSMLAQVDPHLARHLRVLLDAKTLSGYGHDSLTLAGLRRCERAMAALIRAAVNS